MTQADLKDLISECSDDEFNRNHLLDEDPWYFSNDKSPCEYGEFQSAIAKVFGINKASVELVGSGRFGMSLSPAKPFSRFRFRKVGEHKKSDLDVIIVTGKFFELVWEDLLSAFYSGQHYVFNRYAKTTFKKFVSFDKDINISDEGRLRASTKFERILEINDRVSRAVSPLRLENEINFRVYRDWEDVFLYHNWSMSKFRKAMP